LILPDVRFDLGKSDLEGDMHRKQQQQNKQAKKKKQSENKAMRTLKTCGPKDRLFVYHYH